MTDTPRKEVEKVRWLNTGYHEYKIWKGKRLILTMTIPLRGKLQRRKVIRKLAEKIQQSDI